ncbi:MAG: CysZ protein [Thermodesulfobacteriota bacterium]|nr:CysZ protein [Thermodesulfobacteriota bacterium]
MNFIQGIAYNFRGLFLGVKTPKLLFWGLLRFCIVILITIMAASLILIHHQDILGVIWAKPASYWVLWLWHLTSWLLSLCLVGLSTVVSYLISQVLFSVAIMDHMSRITEMIIRGEATDAVGASVFRSFAYLVGQEIPRTIVPVILSILLMIVGWLTPFGPVVAILSSAVAAIFLAWDNTDLIAARQLIPFTTRFRFLLGSLPFHLGFGLPLLIPGLNILLLSFAPVGAAMYNVERRRKAQGLRHEAQGTGR